MIFDRITLSALAAVILFVGPLHAELASRWPLLNGAMKIVEDRGLVHDRADVDLTAARKFIETIEPGSALLTDEERDALLWSRKGYRRCAGLILGKGADKQVLISKIAGRSIKGLAPGDALLAVDGTDVAQTDIFSVYDMLEESGSDPLELSISNRVSSITTTVAVDRVSTRMPSLIGAENLPGGVLYISLRGLYSNDMADAVKDVEASISANGSMGMVLDLRGASGLSIDAAVGLAQIFVPARSNLCSYVELDSGLRESFSISDGDSDTGEPLIVLIDGDTIGAAELFCAICKEARPGIVLLGQKSAGDPLLREFSRLGKNCNLYLIARRLEMEGGQVYDGSRGVEPDIAVQPGSHISFGSGMDTERFYPRKEAEGEEVNRELARRIGDDPALRRAVDILIGLSALGLH